MAEVTKRSMPFFVIVDMFPVREGKDDGDPVVKGTMFYYPPAEEDLDESMNLRSLIFGLVQFFESGILFSNTSTFYFEQALVAAKSSGRHGAFLCFPRKQMSKRRVEDLLDEILDLFHLLHGNWNEIYEKFSRRDEFRDFLSKTLTPIVEYVLNGHQQIPKILGVIDFFSLEKKNENLVIEVKHWLMFMEKSFGMKRSLLAVNQKVLFSTFDQKITFYLQTLFQIYKQLPKEFLRFQLENGISLKQGVSIFQLSFDASTIEEKKRNQIDQFTGLDGFNQDDFDFGENFNSELDSEVDFRQSFRPISRISSIHRPRGLWIPKDSQGSSEDAGLTTDTPDEEIRTSLSDFKESLPLSETDDEDSNAVVKRIPWETQISRDSNEEPEENYYQDEKFEFRMEQIIQKDEEENETELTSTLFRESASRPRTETLTTMEEIISSQRRQKKRKSKQKCRHER